MANSKKILNDDEVVRKILQRCIHLSFGRLIRYVRTISPLSHQKVQEMTTVNSGEAWRMENLGNYNIISYAQAFNAHIKAIKCNFYPLTLCSLIIRALQSGKCLVVTTVDYSEIKNYDKRQIILQQQVDEEELKRRAAQKPPKHMNGAKSGQDKENKKQEKENGKQKKDKEIQHKEKDGQNKKKNETKKAASGKKKTEKK